MKVFFWERKIILVRIAARNLIRRSRKNLVVGTLIAVGVAAFFIGNAVLESSIGGIQQTFSGNFTADLSVSMRSEQSMSLFGPDVPVIGDYESQAVILNAAEIGARVARTPGVQAVAFVLSSPLLLEAGSARGSGLGLGVIGDEYFSLFRGLHFVFGGPPLPGRSGWAVITEKWAQKIESAQGHPLVLGDKIQLSSFRNRSFAIREASVVGVVEYRPTNDALDKVVILDGRILRELAGFSQTSVAPPGTQQSSQPEGVSGAASSGGDVDSLFSTEEGTSARTGSGDASAPPVSVNELRKVLEEAHRAGTLSADSSPLDHYGAWHFILIRTAPGADTARVAADLRNDLTTSGNSVFVKDWRGTAGGIALYVYFMQVVLYIGLFMLGGIVLILTINSLVMSVYERSAEIGTMRAIGAQQGFVRMLFVVETTALTLVSGVAGIILGLAGVAIINRLPFHFNNQILVLLFGGATLHPAPSAWNLVTSLVASLVLGTVAWIYPVRVALRIQPVRAIQAP